MSRLQGFKDLVQDAVDKSTTAVQEVHEAIARRPFTILEKIPLVSEPAQGVRVIHDTVVHTVYDLIRLGNQAAGTVADVAIRALETRSSTKRPATTEAKPGQP